MEYLLEDWCSWNLRYVYTHLWEYFFEICMCLDTLCVYIFFLNQKI